MAYARIAAVSLVILATGCRQVFGLAPPLHMPDAHYDSAGPDADPNAPVCTIVAPMTGSTVAYDATVSLSADATDPQDGRLPDTSITWRTDLNATPLGSGRMLTTQLPVGTNDVSCVATDSTNLVGRATITIISQSPFPTITHPSDGDMRPQNQSIPFNGSARDLEDGAIPGSALAWSSSLDGVLGTGANLSTTLSQGVHTVALAATDSDGNSYVTAINLVIQ